MKNLFKIFSLSSFLLMVLTLVGVSCSQSQDRDQEDNRQIAEDFVRTETTYRFDGIADSFKVTGSLLIDNHWQFTIEFDSLHAGYGNRSGQALAEMITHHVAEITVQDESVIKAIMDGQWDMINQRLEMEITLAPIDEVRVNILKSNPAQIGVYIKGGLPDGCTTFHDIETTRDGNTINIKVTIQRPRGVSCPAIYTYFEKDLNLGSDFTFGTTFTLNVNDYTTTFQGTLLENEGVAIYLTRDDVSPDKMEMFSQIDIEDRPVISLKDILTYNAQTHELKLTDEAFKRIAQMEVPVRGKSFLVCVNKSPVYWGAFWTPVSSLSFEGVTIWIPLSSQEPGVITLELGYPSPSFYKGEDPRNNPLIIQSLEKSGKLINRLSISDAGKLPHSFKGYELYSWQENNLWHFTLITGTNRTKTLEEITSGEDFISEAGWVNIHVVGVDEIKGVLSKLPQGESVIWCGEMHLGQTAEMDLRLPPEQIVKEIEASAKQSGLDFTNPLTP